MTLRNYRVHRFPLRLEYGDRKRCRNIAVLFTCTRCHFSETDAIIRRLIWRGVVVSFEVLWGMTLRNGGAVLDRMVFEDEGTVVIWICRTRTPHYTVSLYLSLLFENRNTLQPELHFFLTFSDFTGSAYPLFWAPAKRLLHGPWDQTFCLENIEFVISEVTSTSSAVCTPTQEPQTLSK